MGDLSLALESLNGLKALESMEAKIQELERRMKEMDPVLVEQRRKRLEWPEGVSYAWAVI